MDGASGTRNTSRRRGCEHGPWHPSQPRVRHPRCSAGEGGVLLWPSPAPGRAPSELEGLWRPRVPRPLIPALSLSSALSALPGRALNRGGRAGRGRRNASVDHSALGGRHTPGRPPSGGSDSTMFPPWARCDDESERRAPTGAHVGLRRRQSGGCVLGSQNKLGRC